MRAPLAPPRWSVWRYVDADAHAVSTNCEMLKPELLILDLTSLIWSVVGNALP